MTIVFESQLRKMQFHNTGDEYYIKPEYYLLQNNNKMVLNNLIGKAIQIVHTGQITCISCGKEIKKTYGQGYCYPCFISVPQTEECVLKPELCRAHEGIARDMEYAKANCLVDQYIYLALSGGLKVGVTRYHQVPTRWVDQGANRAIKIAITKNRYTAGLIEVTLKKILADKTNWRKMLMGNDEQYSLVAKKRTALDYVAQQNLEFTAAPDQEYQIEYPVLKFPSKIVSKDLAKEPSISGLLMGLKGQYLIFEEGMVINIRKHAGFHIELKVE
jgi:hypothetical protein